MKLSNEAKRLAEMVVYGHNERLASDIQELAEQMAHEEYNSVGQGRLGKDILPIRYPIKGTFREIGGPFCSKIGA